MELVEGERRREIKAALFDLSFVWLRENGESDFRVLRGLRNRAGDSDLGWGKRIPWDWDHVLVVAA